MKQQKQIKFTSKKLLRLFITVAATNCLRKRKEKNFKKENFTERKLLKKRKYSNQTDALQ